MPSYFSFRWLKMINHIRDLYCFFVSLYCNIMNEYLQNTIFSYSVRDIKTSFFFFSLLHNIETSLSIGIYSLFFILLNNNVEYFE